jgi:hypothetical protein
MARWCSTSRPSALAPTCPGQWLLVFYEPSNNRVHNIVCSQLRVGLMNKNTQGFYPGSGPSMEVIALRPVV